MFVFSFLMVLGCIGAAAWLFLIDPKDEKPGILTASVEISAPIIIESDADPVPTELENAAGTAPASPPVEKTPAPEPRPVPVIEATPAEPEETVTPEKSTEPTETIVTSAPTIPVIDATPDPEDPKETVTERLSSPPQTDTEATPEPTKAPDPAPVETAESKTETAEEEMAVETAVAEAPESPVSVPDPVIEETVLPAVSAPEVPVKPEETELAEAIEAAREKAVLEAAAEAETVEATVAEEVAEEVAAESEATIAEAASPPAPAQQPEPVDVIVAAVPEVPQEEVQPEAVEEEAAEQEPGDALSEIAPAASPTTTLSVEAPDAPALPQSTETLQAPALPAQTAEGEQPEQTAPTELALQETSPEPDAPRPVETRPADRAAEQSKEAASVDNTNESTDANTAEEAVSDPSDATESVPLETALIIPPAPVEVEERRVVPTPEAEPETLAPAEVVPVVAAPPLWQTHARDFSDPADRPRIAVIISELGVSSAGTAAAIDRLPGAVTLAFNPYGQNLKRWITRAREAGHEILLQLPMEPMGYPRINPGPQALLTNLETAANLERLEWVLAQMEGYVGITNQMGSRFTASPDHMRPVLEVIRDRGLLYLDSRTASNSVGAQVARELSVPVALNNRFLDHKADGDIIDARLAELEEIARKTGSAVGVAYPYSLTLDHISKWADSLADKGLVLAPVSALVNRQDIK